MTNSRQNNTQQIYILPNYTKKNGNQDNDIKANGKQEMNTEQNDTQQRRYPG